MRIALVTHGYPPDGIAGVERYTEALANALVEQGDSVSVVTRVRRSDPRPPVLRRDVRKGHPVVYRLIGGGETDERFLVNHRRLEDLVTIAVAEAAPDVLQINHLLGLPPKLIAMAIRLRIPVVLVLLDYFFACPLAHLQKRSGDLCRGPDEGHECAHTCFSHELDGEARWTLRASFFRRLLEIADCVVCPSATVAAYFQSFAPAAAPIRVVPLGLPREIPPHPLPRPAGERGSLRLAYFGSVVAHKGVLLIVDAIAQSGVTRVRFDVLGRVYEEDYRLALEESAARVPSLDMRIHGEYDDDQLATMLADVDAVVVPSQVPEVSPFVPREALAHGVPVLVGHLGGLPEVVRHGDNGLIFNAFDSEELGRLIRSLASDLSLRESLRGGARRTSFPTMRDHAYTMREIYAAAASIAQTEQRSYDADELDALHDELVAAGFAEKV